MKDRFASVLPAMFMKISLVLLLLAAMSSFVNAEIINIALHHNTETVDGFDDESDGALVSAGSNGHDTWNNIVNNDGVGLSFSEVTLALADGSASGATASGVSGYTGRNDWNNENEWPDDDYVMMDGWYGFWGTESMTISDLGSAFTSNGYNVTIYGDSDKTSRTMNYTIAGSTKTIADSGTFAGAFTEGGNYVRFTGLTAANFTITGNAAGTRSSINGIVIEAIPEPSVVGLGLFMAAIALLRRKVRA